MTERKPPGASWETWIDRQVRVGMERGDFDDLPGHGQPIPDVDRPHDELWWVKQKLAREGVSFLPPTLALRKEVDDVREQIARAVSEAEVRRIVEEINTKIRRVNSQASSGPPSTLVPLPLEAMVAAWREAADQRPS
jgi:Domain of unknown function (DUF1992)